MSYAESQGISERHLAFNVAFDAPNSRIQDDSFMIEILRTKDMANLVENAGSLASTAKSTAGGDEDVQEVEEAS